MKKLKNPWSPFRFQSVLVAVYAPVLETPALHLLYHSLIQDLEAETAMTYLLFCSHNHNHLVKHLQWPIVFPKLNQLLACSNANKALIYFSCCQADQLQRPFSLPIYLLVSVSEFNVNEFNACSFASVLIFIKFIAGFCHEGQLIVELELKSHLQQMLPIAGVCYEYMAGSMIDHGASCLLVYQC